MSGLSGELLNQLAAAVEASVVTQDVVEALLPGGRPHEMETQYWDYKLCSPVLPSNANEQQKQAHRAEICDIVKDAVAFYNGCGGYILFGVADKGASRVVGCDSPFDVGDFNKRIEGATGVGIECLFARLECHGTPLGLLMVPRRPSHIDPATFKRSAQAHANGRKAWLPGDVYVRIRDQCRPATLTSADWKFLQSERLPPGSNQVGPRLRPIRASLPPRDPEMVQFIGREKYLAHMRRWLSDKRSPVRLITGIGGLGKTSVAYHFAEEVIDTRAGGVEQLVWLTAKARTFSALHGKIVETGRVDFADATDLYKVILERLGSFPVWEDEEPTQADYVEAVVEAMLTYNCLLILDDIDSLSADDQREVMFTLSNAASRTVTGDQTPSRILFTSRVDLGVSPASIIKLEGFELDEFSDFVKTTASALGVPLPNKLNYAHFCDATSGSPLFATSVLRLMRLGEDMNAALERWRGEEGVEVRRFAFARELKRLPLAAARLLYAICLLNKTSTIELASVLEVTSSTVTSGLASLQSYHLVVTTAKGETGAEIGAPDDVILTKDVLKEHLGSGSEDIERAAASARNQAETRENFIASTIGQVVALWQRGADAEALVVARKLSKSHPANGDVSCLLARALTKPGVRDWEEAHAKFTLAEKQGSRRPEVVEGLLLTKEHLEDWKGILSLAAKTVSTHQGGEDVLLRAHVRATEELIRISRVRGDRARRIELVRDGITLIGRRLQGRRLRDVERDFFWRKKIDFARILLDDVENAAGRPGDKIVVFDQVSWLVEQDIFISEFVIRGVWALQQWWSGVESRAYVDDGAKGLLRKSISKLEQIERVLQRHAGTPVAEVRQARMDLAYRGGKLA